MAIPRAVSPIVVLTLAVLLAACDRSRMDDLLSSLPTGSGTSQGQGGAGAGQKRVSAPPPEKPSATAQANAAQGASGQGEAQKVDEARLVGLSEAETELLFGRPASISNDPPAVIWRYAGSDCGLALFFYMDVNANAYRVLTYETEPKGLDVSSCAGALHEEKIARSG